MVAGQSGVAKEALQQLHGLLVKAPAADSFKPGDEAVILTNLIRLVQETAHEAPQGMQSCIVNLFKLEICLGSKTPTGNGRAASHTLQALRACISLVPAHSQLIAMLYMSHTVTLAQTFTYAQNSTSLAALHILCCTMHNLHQT